jgi:hypothetical protein
VLPPGHFAVTCGCGMVGGCRQPGAPARTPGSGSHLCTLCDKRVVKRVMGFGGCQLQTYCLIPKIGAASVVHEGREN